MGYLYRKCSRCGIDKNPNRTAYCKECSADYYKTYKFIRRTKSNISVEGVGLFIKRIVNNRYLIEFKDINTIIFFYELLTHNMNEYNNYGSGEQILMMWKRILLYYKSNINK